MKNKKNNNDKKFKYYFRMFGWEFCYRSYACPAKELQEAEQDDGADGLFDYLSFSSEDYSSRAPSVDIDNLEDYFLRIVDTNGDLVREIALSQLGIKKVEVCAFPECKEDEAAAYIIEWNKGCSGSVMVETDIDLSKISIEELKDNITIEYTDIKYWDDSKNEESVTIVTNICCFGTDYSPSDEADTSGKSSEAYIVTDQKAEVKAEVEAIINSLIRAAAEEEEEEEEDIPPK